MSVYAHVTRGPAQALTFSIRDMLLRLWITILFGHTEIDDMNDCIQSAVSSYYPLPSMMEGKSHTICALGPWPTYQEVVRLDIPVNQVLLVDRLDTSKL